MPSRAETHIQNTAPGPPNQMAVATPAMLPVPMVEARAVARAWNWEIPRPFPPAPAGAAWLRRWCGATGVCGRAGKSRSAGVIQPAARNSPSSQGDQTTSFRRESSMTITSNKRYAAMPQLYVSEAVPSPPSTQPRQGHPEGGHPLYRRGQRTLGIKSSMPSGRRQAAGPKFPPRRLLPVRVRRQLPLRSSPSPACLIPSSSCRRRLRSGSSIPSGTGAPAFQSQVTPEQDRRGRPSPPAPPAAPSGCSAGPPLHGYLSRQPCLPGPEDPDSSRQAASRRQARQ